MQLRNLTKVEWFLFLLFVSLFLTVLTRELNPEKKMAKILVTIPVPLSDGQHIAYLLLLEDKSVGYIIGKTPE